MINGDHDQRARLQSLIVQAGLKHHAETILAATGPSIGLQPKFTIDEEITAGKSKLGGRPDVPTGFEWPRHKDHPLSFIAQLNLAEVAALNTPYSLPQTGLLSFFYSDEVWGFSPEDRSGFRILHFSDEPAALTRMAPPAIPKRKSFFGLFTHKAQVREFKSCKLEMRQFLSLPDPAGVLGLNTDEDIDSYYELVESIGNHHRLFGFAEPIQGEMELECQLVTNGLYCGDSRGYKDPKAADLAKNKDQWKLLLQIDSDTENSDMMWGDAGRLYVWSREENLLRGRIDNCWLIAQCY